MVMKYNGEEGPVTELDLSSCVCVCVCGLPDELIQLIVDNTNTQHGSEARPPSPQQVESALSLPVKSISEHPGTSLLCLCRTFRYLYFTIYFSLKHFTPNICTQTSVLAPPYIVKTGLLL